MLGSISKVRPCGHSHYYKYTHCKKQEDIKVVFANYKYDLTEGGEFTYNLDNITHMPEFSSTLLRKFVVPTPKLIHSSHAFTGSQNLVELAIYSEGIGNIYGDIGPSIQNQSYILRKWSWNLPNYVGQCHSNCQQCVFNAGSEVKLYAPKIYNISRFFSSCTINFNTCVVDFYAPLATSANNFLDWGNSNVKELTYQIYPISGNHVFGEEPTTEDLANVDENGEVITEKRYSLFPKLSSGEYMFASSILNKDYILAFAEALPTWTNGKENHLLTLGIHIDHKYDPEVNLALKKLNMDYVTPIEEAGGTLTEEVTSDKGWTTTIQWNGTVTSNAYPAPTTTNEE